MHFFKRKFLLFLQKKKNYLFNTGCVEIAILNIKYERVKKKRNSKLITK
jgi:hypothetical protein